MFTKSIKWPLSVIMALVVLTACQKEDASTEQAANAGTESAANQSVAAETADSGTETEALNAWLDERYEESLQFSPIRLTMLGRKDLYDQINDFTEQATRDLTAWRVQTVEQMQQEFDYDALSLIGKESYDLWVFQTEAAVANLEFLRQGYLFGELGGREDFFPSFLIHYHRVDTEEDMRAYIKRISGLSRAMGQVLTRQKQKLPTVCAHHSSRLKRPSIALQM